MVSTQDSESCDPSSNLGGTYHFRQILFWNVIFFGLIFFPWRQQWNLQLILIVFSTDLCDTGTDVL